MFFGDGQRFRRRRSAKLVHTRIEGGRRRRCRRFSMDGWMASNVEEIQQQRKEEKKRRGKGRERDAGMSPIHFARPRPSDRASGFWAHEDSEICLTSQVDCGPPRCLNEAVPRGSHPASPPGLRPKSEERQRVRGRAGAPSRHSVGRSIEA